MASVGQFRHCASSAREEVTMLLHRIAIVPAFVVSTTAVLAQTVGTERGREIPAYALPVPDDISPQMRPLVAAPPAPWDIHPKSIAEWKELVAKVAAPDKTLLPVMREKLGVKLAFRPHRRSRPRTKTACSYIPRRRLRPG